LAKKVIVVSADVLPYPGYPTSGAGLRAWGLGQGLRANGFDVIFAMPIDAYRSDIPFPADDKPVLWEYRKLESILRSMRPDAVIFGHWPAMQLEKRLDVPSIIDFHGPHMMERAFQRFGNLATNAVPKIDAIRKADYFICAGEKQKAYFLAWLLISGIDLSKQRISAVPVCLSPDLPLPSPDLGEITFVYGGVYLPWQDPSLSLTTVADVLAKRNTGMLRLFGGKHPFFSSEVLPIPPVFRELEARFADHPHVRFEGTHPRDQLLKRYMCATVAVDLMTHNYERELAFTTRTVEYMWCGLPVIYNNYADLAPLIRDYEAGWVLDPTDRIGLEHVIEDILEHPERAYARGQNAQRLVRERLTWDKAVEPVIAFLNATSVPTAPVPDLVASVATELGVRDFWDEWHFRHKRRPLTPVEAAWRHFQQGGISQLAPAVLRYFRRLSAGSASKSER
jgi:glycosyltransferase involved in cell wall biosynthesis